MRVTTQMVATNLVGNLDDLRQRLQSDQTDLATGVSVHVPSDGPDKVALAMQYKQGLRQLDTYDSTMNDSLGWLQTTDGTMDQMNKDLNRIRELAVQASNDTNSQQSLNAINTELDAVYQDLLSLGNNQYNGKYIFAGAKVDVQPFTQNGAGTAVVYNGDNQPLLREVGPGIKAAANLTGSQLTGAVNFYNSILQLKGYVAAGDSQNISQVSLASIDQAIDSLSTQRALLGVRLNEINTLQDRNRETRVNLQTLLSKDIGTDMESTAVSLSLTQNSYQVALAVGAKIVPPTLVDFLK